MTQKTKNILLVVGFILVLVLSYRLAISKTLALKGECNILKKEVILFTRQICYEYFNCYTHFFVDNMYYTKVKL